MMLLCTDCGVLSLFFRASDDYSPQRKVSKLRRCVPLCWTAKKPEEILLVLRETGHLALCLQPSAERLDFSFLL